MSVIESKGKEMQNNLATIYLRHDQSLSQVESKEFNDPGVHIFAPKWVETTLSQFMSKIPKGTQFKVIDGRDKSTTFKLENDPTLKHLIMLARNERANVSGLIMFILFGPSLSDKKWIYSLKDLIRQFVIIGKERTEFYGGYPSGRPVPQEKDVILIDSIGLQFQQPYNTGRLVLITDSQTNKGILDDIIFENVVGVGRPSLGTARSDTTGRYVRVGDKTYFDTFAYEMFVANDILLICLALNQMEGIPDVNLKFLKYGTGFFAGPYGSILGNHISKGVYYGMKAFFETKTNKKIKAFEFPFYGRDSNIEGLCSQYRIKCLFTRDDALKQTDPTLITATTNCADPHSVTGNEMGYSSVDAAIAQNIKSKANKFSPLLNTNMKEVFIEMPHIFNKNEKGGEKS